MSNKTTKSQKKTLEKLNNLFPLPNPSPVDIKKTFEEMGRTLPGEKTTEEPPLEQPLKQEK